MPLQHEIIRDSRGYEVCHRVIKAAVENVKGHPEKGFHTEDAYCNKPVFLNISEGRKECPECDKKPPVGNVNPRVTNAAGITLTAKELQECGVTEDTSLKGAPKVTKKESKPKEIKKAVEAKMKAKKDEIILTVPLSVLESDTDIAAYLIKRASESLDSLPTPTFAESKRLIRIQEKLEALGRV